MLTQYMLLYLLTLASSLKQIGQYKIHTDDDKVGVLLPFQQK